MSLLQPTATNTARQSVRSTVKLPAWLRQLLIGISFFIIWQLYTSFSGVSSLPVASPAATAQALYTDIRNGQLISATLISLQNLAIGMGIGIAVGLFLASLSAFSRRGTRPITMITSVFIPLPGIAILPLAILGFVRSGCYHFRCNLRFNTAYCRRHSIQAPTIGATSRIVD